MKKGHTGLKSGVTLFYSFFHKNISERGSRGKEQEVNYKRGSCLKPGKNAYH